MRHIVVIGAGQAGSSCVVKLRNAGFEGQITLIGEENVPPYQRPPLSKGYLMGDMVLERMFQPNLIAPPSLVPSAFCGW